MFDKKLELSENQDLVKATGDYASTNQIDAGIDTEVGNCDNLRVEVWCTEAFTSANSTATLTVKVESGATTALGTVMAISKDFAIADLKAGKKLVDIGFPVPNAKYVGIVYTIGTEATTAGKVTAMVNPR